MSEDRFALIDNGAQHCNDDDDDDHDQACDSEEAARLTGERNKESFHLL